MVQVHCYTIGSKEGQGEEQGSRLNKTKVTDLWFEIHIPPHQSNIMRVMYRHAHTCVWWPPVKQLH